MIRLNVIEAKNQTELDIINNPTDNIAELAVFYKEQLMNAVLEHTESLNFKNIPMTAKTSDNFQNIFFLEKCIMDHFKNHDYPKQVQIICDNYKAAELYKVVYNFYFPGKKDERLDDENWD